MVDNHWFNNQYNYTVDDRYNLQKKNTEQEVDRILDKINQRGNQQPLAQGARSAGRVFEEMISDLEIFARMNRSDGSDFF